MAAFEETGMVTFSPAAGGGPHAVRAIFDREALVADASVQSSDGGWLGVSTYKPMVSFLVSEFAGRDIPAPTNDDLVMIDSVQYRIIEPQHDGRGEYRAILEKV